MPSRFTKSSPTVSLAQMTVQPLHAMLMNTAEARGRGLSTTSTTSKIWDSRRYNVVSTSLFPQPLIYVQQIWISPVVQNIVASTSDGESYHGYWAQNIYEVNSNFGTAADLQALSAALHARGMVRMQFLDVWKTMLTASFQVFDG